MNMMLRETEYNYMSDTQEIVLSRTQTLKLSDKYQIAINAFEPNDYVSLFNTSTFFKLHSERDDLYIQLLNNQHQVCATLCFYQHGGGGHYISPKRGTFGGLSLHTKLDLQILEAFIETVVANLIAQQAKSITIKLAPFSHDIALSALMTNVLLRNGFELINHELNYDMTINAEPFSNRISYGNKKRIKKCLNHGFVAKHHPLSDINKIYEVIKINRERRGFPLTMTLEQIQTMIELFPDKYHLFAVHDSNEQDAKMVASAVCIAVTESVLYVFYWGDIAGYERFSPIALLADCIYAFCQTEGFKQLDVGTSSLNSEPSYGIAQFKRNLGFTESLKPDFRLELPS